MKGNLFHYRILLLLSITLLKLSEVSAQYKVEVLDSNNFMLGTDVVLSKTSFRGLSVVNDKTIWASGSRGTFSISTDSGQTFVFSQVEGYEKSDFRDIEAFDDKRAVMMSSGSPAYILRTDDGGQSWTQVYKNTDTAYFLDAMDFWNEKEGVILGDPVKGHFILLVTQDGGTSWKELDTNSTPSAEKGEAVFAASGTSMRCHARFGELMFVTGGKSARIIGGRFSKENSKWKPFPLKIIQGKSGQGGFSLAYNDSALIVVGGDYTTDTMVKMNSCAQYFVPGKTYQGFDSLLDDVNGYRSGVEAISRSEFVACGTSGVDWYKNRNWNLISTESFHVVKKSKNGKAVYFAGGKGKIGRLIY